MATLPDEPAGDQAALNGESLPETVDDILEGALEPEDLLAMENLDTPRRVLFVHAHPDDESITTGLTMAHYASAGGVGVTLVTCTRGQQGEIIGDHPDLLDAGGQPDPDLLAEHRSMELGTAMEALGVTDHRFLADGAYRDSGMVWVRPGVAGPPPDAHPDAFALTDLDTAAGHLVSVLREIRPQVVVTYEPGGGYGHPDHVMAHRVTMRAVELAGDAGFGTGQPWQVARVMFVVVPESVTAHTGALLHRTGLGRAEVERTLAQDRPPMVVPDSRVAVEIHDADALAAKVAALRAHATQVTVADGRYALSNEVWMPLLPSEYFEVGRSEVPVSGRLDGFFDGVG